MSRTLTALFDNRPDAEDAMRRLQEASVGIHDVHLHDRTSPGYSETDYSTHETRGFWETLKDIFVPDEDRHLYEEGVRRGGCLLTAEVDESRADQAVRVLEEADTVDLDERSAQWREEGWAYQAPAIGMGYAAGFGATGGLAPAALGNAATAPPASTTNTGEQVVPMVEERLRVGKREVERGSVRVRSYMVDEQVQQDVNLRDETISVERRPVDRTVDASDDAFRERTIEMTETDEEAVVSKDAHVREELVIRKDVGTRTEQVEDTLRHTEVDIDESGDTHVDRPPR